MCDLIHPDAYLVEASPQAIHLVSTSLSRPDRIANVREWDMAHPSNIAFLDIKEDNDLAAHCASSSHDPNFEFRGLDQEFLGSAEALLDTMAATNPGPCMSLQWVRKASTPIPVPTGEPSFHSTSISRLTLIGIGWLLH